MNKIENLIDMAKLNELLGKKEEKKNKSNVLVWFFAIIGIVAAVCAIGYAVYRYLTPDYLEDFDEEFEDEFEDEDEEDDIYEDESEFLNS